MMQTILGAGGPVGSELAQTLPLYTEKIRLVSRNPRRVNNTDELYPADLSVAAQVDKAVEGSEVVYLTVGLEYNISVWRERWPALMHNVLEACKKHSARLVFFDNMYMYDPDHLHHMTEDTPVRPVSEKGKVRAQIAQMLLNAAEKGEVRALIARAPDFISLKNSLLVETVYKNLAKGKKADWFASADRLHNFIHNKDAAKATAMLGNTPDAYKQVWHLPTDRTPLTGKQWIALFAGELGVQPRYRVLPVWMMGLMGVFVPVIREFREMAYQYEGDYVFDSSKFEKRFEYKPMTPEESVKSIVHQQIAS